MKGGMTFFKGTGGTAARRYLEQDAKLAAAGYYTENQQLLATRTVYTATAGIQDIQLLNPDEYQGWVEWANPRTGEKRGTFKERIHPITGKTEQSVLFIDKSINAPKSLSVLAAIDPEFATVLERTMSRAAQTIGTYQVQNLHSRIMRKGVRSWEPIQSMESATVVHKTSREGDPFWHIHFQTLNRVFVDGKWRALDTAELVKHNATINALGTAIMGADPELRTYLHSAGYTLDPATGEIQELVGFVEDFSKRHQQITARKNELIALWEKDHPGESIGVGLMNRIDYQAWADTRSHKTSENSANPEKWTQELVGLGFTPPAPRAEQLSLAAVGGENLSGAFYEQAALMVLESLAEQKSGWSLAAVRAEAFSYLAKTGVTAEAASLQDVAEQITQGVVASSVRVNPDINLWSAPTHLPLLTCEAVLSAEGKLFDYSAALVARETSYNLSYSPLAGALKLGAYQSVDEQVLERLFKSQVLLDVDGKRLSMPSDAKHRQALSAMAGTHQLVVVTGPAGAGKTTLLKASKATVEARGGRQFIIAPSAQGAEVAQKETGAKTTTAHGLLKAFGYDFSTDAHGVTRWSEPKPEHRVPNHWALRVGDQLVVDEAGMLSQDVALRLYEIAVKTGAQLVLTGDYAQLSAVGRGGVLQKAAHLCPVSTDLESIWRFKTATGEIDEEYARLSLKMRGRQDAGAVFDELVTRGAVRLHEDEESARCALSSQWLDAHQVGESVVIAASTNELVSKINTEVALRRSMSGDTGYTQSLEARSYALGMEGQALVVGDVVRTRENNRELGVLNGKSYVVRSVSEGYVRVQSVDKERSLHTLPASYVEKAVQLGYATTVHSAQGMTVDRAHLLVTGHSDGAGLYVGLSRGRRENVAHFVAADVGEAREQFVAAMGRNRADTGIEGVVAELKSMVAGTDLENRGSAIYPTVASADEVQVGDGVILRDKRYLVTENRCGKSLCVVPDDARDTSRAREVSLGGAKRLGLVSGAVLPRPAELDKEIQEYRKLYLKAHQTLNFVEETQQWVKNVRYQPKTVLEFSQAHAYLQDKTAELAQAQKQLESAQEQYSAAQKEYRSKEDRAYYHLQQVKREMNQGGFFQKLVKSNIPLRQAERALGQIEAQAPSKAAVQEASNYVQKVEDQIPVAQERIQQARSTLGDAPVLAGVSPAVLDEHGIIHEPNYEQITAQATAQRQEAVQALRKLQAPGKVATVWSHHARMHKIIETASRGPEHMGRENQRATREPYAPSHHWGPSREGPSLGR